MPLEHVEITKDLLEAVIKEFDAVLERGQNSLDAKDIVRSNLNSICDGIKYCPDRHFSELRTAYNLLKGRIVSAEISLAEFVESTVAAEKENVFDSVFTPWQASQNVHVLNYWKNELRNTLGFEFEYKGRLGTMDQDPFFGQAGNAIDAFFNAFTPERVAKTVAEEISKNNRILNEALAIIDRIEDENIKKSMFVAENGEIVEATGVTENFAIFYLIREEILVKKPGALDLLKKMASKTVPVLKTLYWLYHGHEY